MKKLIYEVFQRTDISPELEPTADIYSDGSVVSRLQDRKRREKEQKIINDILSSATALSVVNDRKPWEDRQSYESVYHSGLSISELYEKYSPWNRATTEGCRTYLVNDRYPQALFSLLALGYAASNFDPEVAEIPTFKEIPPRLWNEHSPQPYAWVDAYSRRAEYPFNCKIIPEGASWIEFITEYHGEGTPIKVEEYLAEDMRRSIEEFGTGQFLPIS